MSHITSTPQPSQAATPVYQAESEHPASIGVRKVLEAYAERELQRVRWGAVIAGLFLAVGAQILLVLLGNAVGLAAANVRPPSPLASIAVSPSVWTTLSALVAFFVGGFSASKLSGSIRRGDGMLAGALTWSTTMVLALLIAFTSMANAPEGGVEKSHAGFAFSCAFLSFFAAMIGGAAGSVSGSMSQSAISARRRELRRREHELETEREHLRQETERRL